MRCGAKKNETTLEDDQSDKKEIKRNERTKMKNETKKNLNERKLSDL